MNQSELLCDSFSSRQWHLMAYLVIVFLGCVLYGHTLHAPFYYDDIINLVDEPVHKRSLDYAFRNLFNPRGIGTLTFALNYYFGGLDPVGYHVVNIAIHLLTSCVIFGILAQLVPGLPGLSLTGALVFMAHPLQTQSVTYIVQRYTSLSGLFLFVAILLFRLACRHLNRDGIKSIPFIAFYAAALVCGAAAVYTKQNAAVLPLLLLLLLYFFNDRQMRHKKLVVLVIPFFIAPLYQIYVQVALPVLSRSGISATAAISSLGQAGNEGIAAATPLTYLVTEFSVIWLYIRLLFVPVHQALIYNYPMVGTLFGVTSIMSFLGIVFLLFVAYKLRNKHKLIACGIIWFFVGLMVESTLIPLDPVFEHRLYLSLFGFALVVIALIRMIASKNAILAVSVLLVVIYGVLTWQRNSLWNSPAAFYEDNLKRAPGKVWLYMCLGTMYIEQKQYARAEILLKRAIELRPDYLKGYNNLATLYDLTGRPEQALAAYRRAAAIDPRDAKVYTNMGAVFAGLKKWDEAIVQHTIAISLKPDYALAYYNLGVAHYSNGNLAQALNSFRKASELVPDDEDVLYNLALVSAESGDLKSARHITSRLTAINPGRGASLAAEISQTDK